MLKTPQTKAKAHHQGKSPSKEHNQPLRTQQKEKSSSQCIMLSNRFNSTLMSAIEKVDLSSLDGINPALTRYGRTESAPILPLREEPDLLTWLEASGRLIADEESSSQEVSTVEEEELSALMGEKEDYKTDEEQTEEEWED